MADNLLSESSSEILPKTAVFFIPCLKIFLVSTTLKKCAGKFAFINEKFRTESLISLCIQTGRLVDEEYLKIVFDLIFMSVPAKKRLVKMPSQEQLLH